MNLLKEIKESLSSTFFFKISFMRVFNFNLNTLIIKLNRSIINLSNNKLMIISIHFELQIKIMKIFNRLNLIIKIMQF